MNKKIVSLKTSFLFLYVIAAFTKLQENLHVFYYDGVFLSGNEWWNERGIDYAERQGECVLYR